MRFGEREGMENRFVRLLLIVVIALGPIAQFVKPVGDALEDKIFLGGSLLSLVAYLLYSAVQRLTALLESIGRQESDQVEGSDLEVHFKEALRRSEVSISVLGYTGETLITPIRLLLQNPALEARRVTLRVLVPDFGREIGVPGKVVDGKAEDDPVFRTHLRKQVQSHVDGMRQLSERIGDPDRDPTVQLRVEFRALHMSPAIKLFLVNGEQVFEGLYDAMVEWDFDPTRSPHARMNHPRRRVVDPQGFQTTLTRWRRERGGRAAKRVEAWERYFEVQWRLARPIAAREEGEPAVP